MARKSRRNGRIESEELLKRDQQESRLRTAAYVRLSSENNGYGTSDSIETQIGLVVDYIARQNDLVLTDTYVDNGMSGTSFDRPEFRRMMEDVKRGKIQCIVVKDLSRFGRNYIETGYYLERILPLLNVRFIAITDNLDSAREGDLEGMIVPFKNIVNTMYAMEFSKKSTQTWEMAKKSGNANGIAPPMGYLRDGDHMIIDPATEPYVRMIFAWRLAGVPVRVIVERLNLIGAPTRSRAKLAAREAANGGPVEKQGRVSDKWTYSAVDAIIRNPAYAGYLCLGKTSQAKYRSQPSQVQSRDEWALFPDRHTPYITEEEFQRLQEFHDKTDAFQEKIDSGRERLDEEYPDYFYRMVYCADCGRPMQFYRHREKGEYGEVIGLRYRCKQSDGRVSGCKNSSVTQEFIKIAVMDRIRELARSAEDIAAHIRKAKAEDGGAAVKKRKDEIQEARKRNQELDERREKLYEDYVEGILDREEFLTLKEKTDVEKREALTETERLERTLTEMERAVEECRRTAEDLKPMKGQYDFNPKLVKELVGSIRLSGGDTVEVLFKCGDILQSPLVKEFIAGAEDVPDVTGKVCSGREP